MDHPLNLQARDENASKEGTLVGLPSEMNLNHFLVWDHCETRRTTVRFLSDICCFFGFHFCKPDVVRRIRNFPASSLTAKKALEKCDWKMTPLKEGYLILFFQKI